ncbi:hypothetical protein [Cronobacter dublinensis]|uniref:hypothetical protein n=1 Tax=Cronobacter dublinensis TaxID=413497 RepID=UPI000CFCC4EF|nr:hypothetical protein [Cronobacter dublinensis]
MPLRYAKSGWLSLTRFLRIHVAHRFRPLTQPVQYQRLKELKAQINEPEQRIAPGATLRQNRDNDAFK